MTQELQILTELVDHVEKFDDIKDLPIMSILLKKGKNVIKSHKDDWQYDDKDKLFKFFADEHNLILTDTELNDIIHAVKTSIGA